MASYGSNKYSTVEGDSISELFFAKVNGGKEKRRRWSLSRSDDDIQCWMMMGNFEDLGRLHL